VQAAQLVGAKRSATVKLAVLPFAGMVALAFATPAHADDQTAPPPLMVAHTAVIAPDEPDATVPSDAGAAQIESAAPAPAPDPAPVRVVAVSGWQLAAKAHVVHRPAPVAAPVRTVSTAPRLVISASPRPVHATQSHAQAKRSRPAAARSQARWYQVSPLQYRHVRADLHAGRTQIAAAAPAKPALAIPAPSPVKPQKARAICELRLRKCLQICSWNAMHNGSQNERWIGACISSYDPVPKLDRLHELLLQRLWSIALDARNNASGRQYQCLGAQYQSGTCNAARSSRPTPVIRMQPQRYAPVISVAVAPRTLASVTLRQPHGAATVAATRGTRAATKTVAPRPRAAREAAPAPAGGTGSSADWLLRTLVALIGVAMLALLLAASSQLPAAGTAVAGMRTRLGSKGLSSARIDLGRERVAPPRGRGISYRD
jgi:hypothetical protein